MYQGKINLTETSSPTAAMQRACGRAHLAVAPARGATRLVDLAQSGSARLLLPRVDGPVPEAVFLNTSGGLTSGDRLSYSMSVADHGSLTATTQTAERAYLATSGPASLSVTAKIGTAGWLDWLPQETILFEGADLERETRIDLATGAGCLLVETLVLGRRAMGETLKRVRLRDHRRVTLQGRPLWFESLDLSPEVLTRTASPAVLGGAIAFATLVLCGAGSEAATPALRGLAAVPGVTFAVTGWNGRAILRATATDLWPLKGFLGRAIATLTDRPLPRVWQMQGIAP